MVVSPTIYKRSCVYKVHKVTSKLFLDEMEPIQLQ